MLGDLKEFLLQFIIGITAHKREPLTKPEQAAQKEYQRKLEIKYQPWSKPIIVGMIGLVGSGKTSVAKELAPHLNAAIVEDEAIQLELSRKGASSRQAQVIAENVAVSILTTRNNVIIDADFIDAKDRASLRQRIRGLGARLVFVSVHAHHDVMFGRLQSASYHDEFDDKVGNPSSPWKGDEQSRGATKKLREMWRRTPYHFSQHKGADGNAWVRKQPPCTIVADIDTTDSDGWKLIVARCAQELSKSRR